MAIKPNRMEFAQLPTKPSYPNDAKKNLRNFFGASQKKTKRRSMSGVHIL
jgi:hypothetical protein